MPELVRKAKFRPELCLQREIGDLLANGDHAGDLPPVSGNATTKACAGRGRSMTSQARRASRLRSPGKLTVTTVSLAASSGGRVGWGRM